MHINNFKKFYFIDEFDKDHLKNLNDNTAVIYRNYNIKYKESEIQKINNFCRSKRLKFFLSNNVKLAIKLRLNGVYIPSFNKELKINYYSKKKNFLILGSAHNIKEIRQKELQKVNCIFISPIFRTNKSNRFLGIQKFNKLTNYTKKKIICLGGIKKNNLNKIKLANTYGFSSISLFRENIKYIRF